MSVTLEFVFEGDSMGIMNRLLKEAKGRKICYVTLNKSCAALREWFGDLNIYFIDGISSMIGNPKNVAGCVFVRAPYELSEVAMEVKKAIAAGYTYLVFDSISNLFIYGASVPGGENLLVNCINMFKSDLEKAGGDAVFVADVEDEEKVLIQESLFVFDEVKGKSEIYHGNKETSLKGGNRK